MNPKDSSYLLRDDFYKHVQRDWPGYSEEERQLISRLLARWVRHTSSTKSVIFSSLLYLLLSVPHAGAESVSFSFLT